MIAYQIILMFLWLLKLMFYANNCDVIEPKNSQKYAEIKSTSSLKNNKEKDPLNYLWSYKEFLW